MRLTSPNPPKATLSGKDDPVALRAQLLATVRPAFEKTRASVRDEFLKNGKAETVLSSLSRQMDELIDLLIDHCVKIQGWAKTPAVAIMALGGYGRRELFPYSDIDLCILYEPKAEKEAEILAEWVAYALWDLGLTVGQALRTVPEALELASKDFSVCAALLDARLLWGSKTVSKNFETRFAKQTEAASAPIFVEAKLNERDARHKRWGDSRYVLEPNVKEGKGGLRDLHTLHWLARYIYHTDSMKELVDKKVLTPDEYKAFVQAERLLETVRVHLHYAAGRAEERLTFDRQRIVAERMGYTDEDLNRAIERFMKRYFVAARVVGSLTRSVCAVLEEEKKRNPLKGWNRLLQKHARIKGFIIDGQRLNIDKDDAFETDPVRMIELFAVAHEEQIDIHPRALQLASRQLHLINRDLLKNPRANTLFMEILLSKHNPEPTLRRMNEAGVLGRFIPDFGRLTGQMQFDMYHHYTVDEHTLFALGNLHGMGEGKYADELPLTTKIFPLVKQSMRALYMGLLCHDIAKGRGGDHSKLGADIARKLALRFGCTEAEAETAAWLVGSHLIMTLTAYKRDINDPQTIRDFIAVVQSPQRLRLLLLLTVADIRAVGPNVWNGWKGALLRDLYYKAEALMGGSEQGYETERLKELATELKERLHNWSEAEIALYLQSGTTAFMLSCDADTHARIARNKREYNHLTVPLKIDTRSDEFRAITELIILTPDQHGLFAKLSGALALLDINIMGAKIFTLKDGTAVDIFQLQDSQGQALTRPDKLAKLAVMIEQVLGGEINVDQELAGRKEAYPSRLDGFKVPSRVFTENQVSAANTVIEVGGRDRIGFLYAVTKALTELGLTITTAHISTYGERAVDVFYVRDVFGMKILHDAKLKQIRETLLSALGSTEGARPDIRQERGHV